MRFRILVKYGTTVQLYISTTCVLHLSTEYYDTVAGTMYSTRSHSPHETVGQSNADGIANLIGRWLEMSFA